MMWLIFWIGIVLGWMFGVATTCILNASHDEESLRKDHRVEPYQDNGDDLDE